MLENMSFRNLDLFLSSAERREASTLLGPLITRFYLPSAMLLHVPRVLSLNLWLSGSYDQ
jgi:hypothetical protein